MSIGTDGRCTLPSTHIRGGGYVEVECYCEAHALDAAKKYGDTELPRVLDPNHGCLDTTVGLVRNRRRCQWEEGEARRSAAELSAQLSARTAEVDAVRREAAALFETEHALRRGLYAENEGLRKRIAELEATTRDETDALQAELSAAHQEIAALRAKLQSHVADVELAEIGMAFNSIAARLNRPPPALNKEYTDALLELCGRTRGLAYEVAVLKGRKP